MIELIETYSCEEYGCGRKFVSIEELFNHYYRRHLHLYEMYKNKRETELEHKNNLNRSKSILDDLYNKIGEIEKIASENILLNENENCNLINHITYEGDLDDNHSVKSKHSLNITTSSFNDNEKVTIISNEMLGIGSKYADYDEVDEINLDDKNLICFKTKKNVNFTYLMYVTNLSIANNFIKDLTDLKCLNTIRILNISNNKVDDMSPLEYLENLEQLYAERNLITSISSLNKCKSLIKLEIGSNKIKYETSTYKTLQNLPNLRELSIKDNPFLLEVFGYRHLFIYKYPRLKKLDNQDISEIDREVAIKFTEENSILNKERPTTSGMEQANNNLTQTNGESYGLNRSNKTIVKDKIISQIEYKPRISSKEQSSHPLRVIKNNLGKAITNNIDSQGYKFGSTQISNFEEFKQMKKEIEELRNENQILAQKNKSYELEIQTLKLELENTLNMNKEYEKLNQNDQREAFKGDEEKRKLREEIETWKKEYCELLNKSMSTNVSTSRLLASADNFRPQTAKIKMPNFDPNHRISVYDKTLEELNTFKNESMQLKRKNSLDDSLNHSDSYKSKEVEDDNSDNEIDDLLRKSVTNLESLKSEIKILSKADIKKNNHTQLDNKSQVNQRNRSMSKPKIARDNLNMKNKLNIK